MYPTIRRVLLFLLVGTTAVIAAAIGTGRVAFEVTEGTSMEPAYGRGDVVVTARTGSYRMGDIVAYHNKNESHVILHRIIGGDAAGFVLKGDNNQSIDSTQPAADEVIGRAVLHIPHVGAVLRPPVSYGLLGGLVLILVGGLFVTPSRRSAAAPVFIGPTRRVGNACRALLVVDVLVLVGVLVTFASPPRPAVSATPVGSSQIGVLAYHADVPVSDTYPTGTLVTGDPVFTNLLDSVAVSFHYATDAPASVHGTAALELTVEAPSGWHTSVPLVPATELVAGTVDVTGTVDLDHILTRAERVAEATGVGAGATLDVTVIATASVSVDGADPVAFSSRLPFKLTTLTLTLSGVKPSASPQGPVVSATTALDEPAPARQSRPTPNRSRLALLAVLSVCVTATLLLWPRRTEGVANPG